eukprot:gene37266-60526_t
MFTAIAMAERYTGDWIPFLVCAAAFGLATPVWTRPAATLLALATLWACLLTFAMTLHYQGDAKLPATPRSRGFFFCAPCTQSPMSHSIVPSPRPTHRLVLWLVGFVAFFAIACVARNYPPLPAELTLRLKFPPGQAGRLEPLVSAGVYEKGDFLFVRYLDETTAEFIYNYWGFPGVTSERFTFSPG